MASKALLVLGVLLATVLVVSAEAAAREVAVQHQEKKANEAGVVDQKYGGYPGGGGGYPGGGNPGGGYPGGGYPGGGGYPPRNGYYPGPGRGRCYHGCCRRGYYGGCQCCKTADEMPDAEYLAEPHY